MFNHIQFGLVLPTGLRVSENRKKKAVGKRSLIWYRVLLIISICSNCENPILHFGKGESGLPACQITHTGIRWREWTLGRPATAKPLTSISLVFRPVFVNSSLQSDGKQESENDRLLRKSAAEQGWGKRPGQGGIEMRPQQHWGGKVWAHQQPPYFQVTALNKAWDWIPWEILFKMSPAWPRENKSRYGLLKTHCAVGKLSHNGSETSSDVCSVSLHASSTV